MNDDKKYLSRVPIEPDKFAFLIEQANFHGIPVGDFAGIVLEKWAGEYEDQKENPTELDRFYWNAIRFRRDKQRRDTLYRMAAIYSENPTEGGADLLQEQCDILSVDYTALMMDVGKDPFSSIVVASRAGTKFDTCVLFLTQLFRSKEEFLVSTIKQHSRSAGFAWSMVQRVRDAINEDFHTPRIRSLKRGKVWAWRLDVDDDVHIVPARARVDEMIPA